MNNSINDTLYIFIDESGNFDFSPKGTKFWSLTSISTMDPVQKREILERFKYELLRKGINISYFKASEDASHNTEVLLKVFEILNDSIAFDIDSVMAQKNKANPSLYRNTEVVEKLNNNGMPSYKVIIEIINEKFYGTICRVLLQYIFRRYENKNLERVVIVLGAIFTSSKQEIIKKHIKEYLKDKFPKLPFNIYFHPVIVNINSQIADYCGWAIYVHNERKQMRDFGRKAYECIQSKIKSEFPIFAPGDKIYYEYK